MFHSQMLSLLRRRRRREVHFIACKESLGRRLFKKHLFLCTFFLNISSVLNVLLKEVDFPILPLFLSTFVPAALLQSKVEEVGTMTEQRRREQERSFRLVSFIL